MFAWWQCDTLKVASSVFHGDALKDKKCGILGDILLPHELIKLPHTRDAWKKRKKMPKNLEEIVHT
jgi:hypothetical protein